ncbi:antibiotic biosynthesis monooxygenase family protein [Marinobacter sp. X15-166B]|uniref:antibiotic biosynthesis monooxygenase family protein n=1 Tax=Marinobacter sp. X15-166B TaxID=1897620 RepID=UPI00085BD3A1|nr:hypothetical protein [Marinobacter sp. X15-166B]OEY67502.1 hypothetical protein BG841_14360 [Marinobacter sp. X15-166B]
MYARHFTFKSTADNRPSVEKIADDIYGYTKSLQGFVSATYTVSEDETEYGSFTVWQTRKDAEAAAESIREKVMPQLEAIVTAPPEVSMLEVYEPRS